MMKLGSTSVSSMITSGAPVPASMVVLNLVYSSLPWPALLQQIWTSLWVVLNRSTTASKAGYQAHTVTCSASGTLISLVQPPEPPPSAGALSVLPVPPVVPPPEQAVRAVTTMAALMPVATQRRRWLRDPRMLRIRILLDPRPGAVHPQASACLVGTCLHAPERLDGEVPWPAQSRQWRRRTAIYIVVLQRCTCPFRRSRRRRSRNGHDAAQRRVGELGSPRTGLGVHPRTVGRRLDNRRAALEDAEVRVDTLRDMLRRTAPHLLDQQPNGCARDLLTAGVHRGQRRVGVRALVDRVEADHRDVLGYPQTADLQLVQRAEGHRVVQGEDGVGLRPVLEQPGHRLGAGRPVPQTRLAEQTLVHRDAGRLERLPVPT